jgi:hypothetical protein
MKSTLQCQVPRHIRLAASVRAAEIGTTLGGVVTKALCFELGIKNVPSQPKRGAPKKL